jgi:phosphatidylglycerol:prolipoprotein diacylglycerol transferase
MSGCGYGKPTTAFFGITFTNPNSFAQLGIPLYPTQIAESFLNLILFFILNAYNKKPHKDGLAIAYYLISYAVYRFILEFFRGDFRGTVVFGLSTSQFISVFIFIAGIIIIYKVKNAKNNL